MPMITTDRLNSFRQRISYFFSNYGPLIKMPLYLATAGALFYFCIPFLVAIPVVIKALVSLLLAPFLVETTLFAMNSLVRQIVNRHRDIFLAREIERAIQRDDFNHARAVIESCNSPSVLMSLALRLMRHTTGNFIGLLNTIVMRLQSIAPLLRRENNFRLLREAAFHQNEEMLRILLATNEIQNSTEDFLNLASRSVWAACRNGNQAILEMLLTLPIVLRHITRESNRALRMAEVSGHIHIVNRLLEIPAVANFVMPVRFDHDIILANEEEPSRLHTHLFSGRRGNRVTSWQHRRDNLSVQEDQDGELSRIGQASESSMTQLNDKQQRALVDMQERYSEQYHALGQREIFDEIRAHLITEYEKNPVKDALGQPLPIERPDNYDTNNNRAYYQHIVHGAYRYLFMRPNPWKSPSSSYDRSDMWQEDKVRIAYMWLAATDKTRSLPDGQTHESLLFEFAQALYEICRAHNFDATRFVERTRINSETRKEETYQAEENYDDMRGDKPSCGGGISQRITQFYMVFLNDTPETRPLSAEIMRTKFKEQMVNESDSQGGMFHKLRRMNTDSLRALQEALLKKYVMLEEISDEEQEYINRLQYNQADKESFAELCKIYYGANRITQQRERNDQIKLLTCQDRFNNYEALIGYLGEQAPGMFYQDVERNINKLLDNPSLLVVAANDAAPKVTSQERRRTRRRGSAHV